MSNRNRPRPASNKKNTSLSLQPLSHRDLVEVASDVELRDISCSAMQEH